MTDTTKVVKLTKPEREVFWKTLWRSVKIIAHGKPVQKTPPLHYDPKLYRRPK